MEMFRFDDTGKLLLREVSAFAKSFEECAKGRKIVLCGQCRGKEVIDILVLAFVSAVEFRADLGVF
jgi:hypothetical protein